MRSALLPTVQLPLPLHYLTPIPAPTRVHIPSLHTIQVPKCPDPDFPLWVEASRELVLCSPPSEPAGPVGRVPELALHHMLHLVSLEGNTPVGGVGGLKFLVTSTPSPLLR